MSSKPLALIVGLTGRTGQVIGRELLANGTFVSKQPHYMCSIPQGINLQRVAGIVRPESRTKPLVAEFAAAGVELREGDISKDDIVTLTRLLDRVDTVISTVLGASTGQTNLIYAAKAANVKRFVPSEFAWEVPRGVITMLDSVCFYSATFLGTDENDQKLDDRELIKKLGLGYTFIQIGWWTHALVPYSHKLELSRFEKLPSTFIADGNQKVACTALKNIGKFVARIIADPRTLNQLVMTWDGEWTQREAWDLTAKMLGEDFSDYPKVKTFQIHWKVLIDSLQLTPDQVEERKKEDILSLLWFSLSDSLYIRGDNTVEKAVAAGALDARQLYPDYEPTSLEEVIREFSANPLRHDPVQFHRSQKYIVYYRSVNQ